MPELALYQELIIDHGTKPRNKHTLENTTHQAIGNNPICGDTIQLFLEIENDIIQSAAFTGEGCAISTASASIMTELLKNKPIQEANRLFNHIQSLLTNEQVNSTGNIKLDALGGVKHYPMRVKCATLAWHALKNALDNNPNEISTEQPYDKRE